MGNNQVIALIYQENQVLQSIRGILFLLLNGTSLVIPQQGIATKCNNCQFIHYPFLNQSSKLIIFAIFAGALIEYSRTT